MTWVRQVVKVERKRTFTSECSYASNQIELAERSIKRRCQNDSVRTGISRKLSHSEHFGFRCVENADQDRNSLLDLLAGGTDQFAPYSVTQGRPFTSRAAHEKSVDTPANHMLNKSFDIIAVKFILSSERGHHWRDNAAQSFVRKCHSDSLRIRNCALRCVFHR